ncbi:hypothetical protein CWO89_25335 [Bradyrhizobium sp. Leo170]|nr:hypothetical protein CWO89_25335 [Bradyrhizobium sp. Leo170]
MKSSRNEAALPLPLAGEGWGEGLSAKRKRLSLRGESLTRRCAIAEAPLRRSLRTAAEGGLCLSRLRGR